MIAFYSTIQSLVLKGLDSQNSTCGLQNLMGPITEIVPIWLSTPMDLLLWPPPLMSPLSLPPKQEKKKKKRVNLSPFKEVVDHMFVYGSLK